MGPPARTAVDEFERAREVRRVEALDVRGDTATAALDALERVRHPKGVREHRYRFSGPVVLERVDGRWRLVDWAFQGRRRLESLVLGLLAEQTQGDVTVRVLGVDRLSVATRAIVEVENRSSDPAEVRRAFVGRRRWVPGWCVPSDPVSPRRRARREIGVAHGFQVGAELDVALELRVGERRLAFRLPLPTAPADEPLRPGAPQRLPPGVWAPLGLSVALSLAGLGALAWFAGWIALIVPIALGLSWRGAILRPVGAWGRRLRPLVAGLWLACVALAFWKLSVAEYVVPAAVAAVVYVALRRSLRRWAPLLAVAAGVAWLYFLGGDSRPLSACRLLGRSPERTARAFARAYLVGDVVGARRLVTSAARPAVEPSSRALAPGAALRRLPPAVFGGGLFCARASRCYAYTGTRGRHTAIVWIGVTCEGTHWRVESFAGG